MIESVNVETNLFSTAYPHISKRTNIVSVLLSLGIALLGCVCIVISLGLDDSSVTISMVLLTVGTVLLLYALYRVFWRSAEIVYTPTRSVIRERTFYVNSADLEALQRILENKDLKLFSRISFKQSGNGRIDCMFSKDGEFMAVQLFHFVPYAYEPFSAIYYYSDEDAKAFKRYITIKK